MISFDVDFEAGRDQILDLLMGSGKEFAQMDRELLMRFERVVNLIETLDSIEELAQFRSLDLKFFDDHYQVRVGGEKRLWFEAHEGTLLITYFGSTDHKHGRKR